MTNLVTGLIEVLDRNRTINEVNLKKGYGDSLLTHRQTVYSQYYCEPLERMYKVSGER